MYNNKSLVLLIACIALLSATAFAGGPLLVDPQTRQAYHYSSEPIPVFYDLGNFATPYDYNTNQYVTFDNSVGKHLVEKGFGDWSNLPTTSLRAVVQGDFSRIGLPDIDATNVTEIIGKSNGRGIYVIFDADGSIMENFFGVGPNVLGISSPQFSIEGTTIITESWTVLNGAAVDPNDRDPIGANDAAYFQGVATHEFGHALGLAHTQTNGAAYFYSDPVGPASCTSVPYATNLTVDDIETMYPYINPLVGGTGMAQANLHTLDTISAISDLYPGPGWPNAYGTISGKVYDLNGKTELTGVNVIARNVADPFADSVSALTGQMTQGQLGPDGSFTLHGLKPGAKYAIYLDAVMAGGFPTPPQWFLPGPEKFFAYPSTIQASAPCRYNLLSPKPGSTVSASMKFDHLPGAPMLYQLGYAAGVSDISGDGTIVVGNYGLGGPVFRWTAKTGVQSMNVPSTGEITNISRNGRFISSNLYDPNSDSAMGAFRWDATNGWVGVKPVGTCGTDTTVPYGVADDGSVYGMAYKTCNDYKAFRWNPKTGTQILPSATTKDDGSPANGRPNRISADGSTVVGWEEVWWGGRIGTVWRNGQPSTILDADGNPTSEAYATSSDGSIIAGGLFDGQAPNGNGWWRAVDSTELQYIKPLSDDASPLKPFAVSKDGSVMAGFSGDPWFSFQPAPFIWTKQLGAADLNEFVKNQGTSIEQWSSLWQPMAISDDGTVLAGWGIGFQWYGGWVLDMKKAFVCHADSTNHLQSTSVAFPKSFDEHLAHGDTPGRCPDAPPAP